MSSSVNLYTKASVDAHAVTPCLLEVPRNREPQEYSRNMIGLYLPGSLDSYNIPTTFSGFPVLGSLFSFINPALRMHPSPNRQMAIPCATASGHYTIKDMEVSKNQGSLI